MNPFLLIVTGLALGDLHTLSSEIRSNEKDIEDAQNLIRSGKTMTLQERQALLDPIEMDRSHIAAYWPDPANDPSFPQANRDLLTEEERAFGDRVRKNLHWENSPGLSAGLFHGPGPAGRFKSLFAFPPPKKLQKARQFHPVFFLALGWNKG